MPVTIPIEAYEELEKGLGKEGARKIVKALESVISEATEYKWKVSKEEILDAMRKEFDNMRSEFNGQSNSLRSEFNSQSNSLRSEFNGHSNSLRSEFDGLRNELRKEFVTKELFESEFKRVEMKLNFLIILMIIALTLMNPVMAEIIKGLLKL